MLANFITFIESLRLKKIVLKIINILTYDGSREYSLARLQLFKIQWYMFLDTKARRCVQQKKVHKELLMKEHYV